MSIDPKNENLKVTEDYPGFVVHDERVSGSITLGHTRLTLWAIIQTLVDEGYAATVEDFPTLPNDATASEIGWFLKDLLEQRGEFGRLLCVLADVERRERERRDELPPGLYAISPRLYTLVGKASEAVRLPLIHVDAQNAPPALIPWYAEAENVERVRAALRSALDELDRLETRERQRSGPELP